MLKAQPVLTPLLVDYEEEIWPHTTTNDGESICHFLRARTLLVGERPQAAAVPCDLYLDMGRIILGRVGLADEGFPVINFFAWLFPGATDIDSIS
ncbi:hypothetical protein N5K55_21770 [Pseudomonas aeruginosa]|nr:hypothetical protein [Pseudomonas aeruginosa]